jgi:hypothetical protein
MAEATDAPRGKGAGPREIPCLLVRKGRVFHPGPEGPEPTVYEGGAPVEVFDAFDRLVKQNRRIYVVDLDGIEHNEPQLDLWQEISRDADLWIDAGPPNADMVVDVIVSGARRAILSTARLSGLQEVRRAWKLSQELAFEIELVDGVVPASAREWAGRRPEELAADIRAIGPEIIILSPRGQDVDWELVRKVSEGGSTWVGGSYQRGSVDQLARAGARGGIFHPPAESWTPPPS